MQVTGQEVPHDPSWPLPLQLYVVIHFLLALGTYHDLFENKMVRICVADVQTANACRGIVVLNWIRRLSASFESALTALLKHLTLEAGDLLVARRLPSGLGYRNPSYKV